MKKSANRRAPANRGLWEDADSQYNPDAQSIRTSERRGKFLRVLLRATVFGLFPVACICAIVAIGVLVSAQNLTKATVSSVDTNSSRGKSVAWTTVQDWLAADPSPLPDGRIMSWDGFQRWEPPKPKSDRDKPLGYEYETHRFTLQRGNALYSASVQVIVNGEAASALGTPDLTPIPLVADKSNASPWFDAQDASAGDAVNTAVKEWAAAFTSGDPSNLRRVVRDADASHVYVPMDGVASVVAAQVVKAAYPVKKGDPDGAPDKTRMLVQVQVQFWWDGQEPTEEQKNQGAEKTPQAITYDLLVQDADTANAYVTAWGGPGEAPRLTPYMNAMTGVDPEQSSGPSGKPGTPGPTTSPTPTPTSTRGTP
ncbi:hypothetical protein [Microbacterium xylanilyticum]